MRRLIAAAALVALLAGCSSDPLAEQANTLEQGYISGDGSITEIPESKRGEPIRFEGTTDAGESIDSADFEGEVLVVNFWYAGCPPCRVEAPDLQALNEQFEGKGVSFLGVNVRDQAETSRATTEKWGLTYPSIVDANDKTALLAFAGEVSPRAVPTTLVLDKQGRVAARYLGLVAEPSILETIIDDTLAESD